MLECFSFALKFLAVAALEEKSNATQKQITTPEASVRHWQKCSFISPQRLHA
jgi:hypothetical protein